MTKETAEFLKEAIENNGGDATIHEDYSGRGMYGSTTCGIVVDDPMSVLADVLKYISESLIDEDNETCIYEGRRFTADSFRMDNMGRRTIIY